ncbi:MAG: hypothetical protein E7172_05725 [Firmicutes bacterium]|nr:hypothetical protein [Bacillota bacterium]
MHCEKFNKGGLGNLFAHFERRDNEKRKYKNENIDKSKSKLNYNLAPLHEEGLYNFTKNRVKELNILNRKNTIWVCDWCISAPKEIIGDYEKCKQFFSVAYSFLENKYRYENIYGKEYSNIDNNNIVSSYVHFDEGIKNENNESNKSFNSAHMHFCFIPVINKMVTEFDSEKGELISKNTKKVCAKELITRVELKSIHNDMQRFINENLDFDAKILNGGTIGKNLSVNDLKRKTELEKQIKENEQKLELMKKEISILATNFLNLNEKASYYNKSLIQEQAERERELQGSAEQIKNIINSYDVSFDIITSELEKRDNKIYNIDLSYNKSLEILKELDIINKEAKKLEGEIENKVKEYNKNYDDELDFA